MSDASLETMGEFQEGDRCTRCCYWWWRDGGWHSLVPISYHDNPQMHRKVVCPHCKALTA